MVIKELLVYASQVRLNGYISIPMNYYTTAIELLYSNSKKFLVNIDSKYVFNKNNSLGIYINAFLPSLGVSKAKLISSEKSDVLTSLYLKAKLSDSYKELAFQLFLMGLIEPHNYLKYNIDLDYVLSRFEAKSRFSGWLQSGGILNKIELTYAQYRNLMSVYIENMSSGVDYGYPVWDFIYSFSDLVLYHPIHLWNKNHYTSIIKSICNLKIVDYSIFKLTDTTVKKYCTEVSLVFPLIINWLLNNYSKENISKLFMYLLDKADKYLYQSLLSNPRIMDAINSDGVEIK